MPPHRCKHPRGAMPTLLELQRAMRHGLTSGDDAAACAFVISDGLQASQRLDVYRNGFLSRLTSALRLSYPAVHRLVGAEFFEGAARLYIEDHPPRSAYLDEYGGDFAEFLAHFSPAASLAYLPDVARLEWAVSCAAHAPEAEPLDPARLMELDGAERAHVRFVPHPSVALLQAGSPADLIWRSVLEQDDAALAAIDPGAGPVWLLVERRASGIQVERLTQAEWRFTVALCAGLALHEVLDATSGTEAGAVLARHLAAGRFTAIRLDDHHDIERELST